MDERLNRIPPIVANYIEKLKDKGNNRFQKDIACQTLELIIQECQTAVHEYKWSSSRKERR